LTESSTEAPSSKGGRVRTAIVLPADPERMAIGGIASFIRGFVKFAPADFDITFVGVSSTRPVGRWHDVELEGRAVRFMPVSRGRAEARTRVPHALKFVVGLVRARRRLGLGRSVLSFHRPGTHLPFSFSAARQWRVVHLSVSDLATSGGESRWRMIPRLLAAVERHGFRRMQRIYVVNERVAAEYRARFPEVADRIRYLPNWADPTIFFPRSAPERIRLRRSLAEELRVEADGPIVLFAGRLEGQKDPQLLGETFAALRSDRPDACLIVAGEGSLEGELRRALATHDVTDAVRFVGTVERTRLAELMNASDVLVITSRYETGPTVGFEALACGLPIVSTDVGQVAHVIRAGGTGRVVDERAAAALARAIEWTVDQPREELRDAAVAAADPFLADRVLGEVYADSRTLAQRS
jgi:glycosyltransferase involved in cell wall biosynthesis